MDVGAQWSGRIMIKYSGVSVLRSVNIITLVHGKHRFSVNRAGIIVGTLEE